VRPAKKEIGETQNATLARNKKLDELASDDYGTISKHSKMMNSHFGVFLFSFGISVFCG
jgi:hypothetical protein